MKEYMPIFEKSIKNKAKEEALSSFERFGVETKWVDITDNGITIRQFDKMVRKVYERGYRDGLEKHRELTQKEKEGKALLRMRRMGKEALERDIYKI